MQIVEPAWHLRFEPWHLAGPSEQGEWRALEPGVVDAAWLRRALTSDPSMIFGLRRIGLESEGALAGLPEHDSDSLCERVAGLLERGVLRAWARSREPAISLPPSPEAEARADEGADEEREQQLHWIEIEVVGEDDLQLAGVLCEIELPDGKKLRRRTDHNGLIRIDGIVDAGSCTLVFPELDAEALEAI